MKTIKTWKEAMRDFFESLTDTERSVFRSKAIENCGVSESTFYRWRRGLTLPPFECRKKINYIAVKMGYDRVFVPKKTI